MNFLNSLALWGGLAAVGVAVPILIHLLYRKHKKETDWAAMDLLRRALVIRSGQVRLEDYLMLFLRCLLLASVAFALLRPTLRESDGGFAGTQRVGSVLGIDASYSMGHGQLANRYEQALEKARTILATINVGDPTTVLLMGNGPRMILRTTGYDERRFAEALTETSVLPERLNLERCLAEMVGYVSELKTPTKECYIVTDAQASDWASLSDGAKADFEQIAETANLYIVPVTASTAENLAVTRFEYASGSLRRSGTARFSAEIRNFGTEPQNDGTATFYVDDQAITRQSLGSIAPGAARVLSFFTSFDAGGEKRLKVSLGHDELNLDNARYSVVKVHKQVNVLCVDGEPAAEGQRNETFFLTRALQLKQGGGAEAPLHVIRTHWEDLPAEKFEQFEVIMLANVPTIDVEVGKRLGRYVSRGGGLVVFSGDQVNPDSYNLLLQFEDKPLLPAELLEPTQAGTEADAAWRIGPVQSDHVLARLAAVFTPEELDSARFVQASKTKPNDGGVTLLSLTGNDLPLLLEKKTGQGSALLFTTSADREWANLAIHPFFPMLIQQTVTYLTSRPADRHFVVGHPAHIVIEGKQAGTDAVLLDPGGRERSVTLLAREDGLPACSLETDTVGYYKASVGEEDGASIAVNIDPLEADVKVLDSAALEKGVSELDVRIIGPNDALATLIKENRVGRELSHVLLVLAALLFLVQCWLARHFTRRMRVGETVDVTESVRKQTLAAARKV